MHEGSSRFVGTDADRDDVEKRWHDPAAMRAAVVYTVIVAAASGAVQLVAAGVHAGAVWALATPVVLFAGGVGAFYRTWRVWRTGGTWPIWHGAGWFLLTAGVLSLAVAGGMLLQDA